jgi:hypothetical protein
MNEPCDRNDNEENKHCGCDDDLGFGKVVRHGVLLGGIPPTANGWRAGPQGGEEASSRTIMGVRAHQRWAISHTA